MNSVSSTPGSRATMKSAPARLLGSLDAFSQDARFGLRVLGRNPGFAAVAILTLVFGIGANTAIFSLVNTVFLNTLPAANPHELVLFSEVTSMGGMSGVQTGTWQRFSSDDYEYFRDHNQSFKELAAYQTDRTVLSVHIAGAQLAESARSTMVSGNFFPFLGIRAAAGRLLSPDDDRASSAPVAVLDYGYWTQRFHNDPAAIGETIEADGIPFTIVGVAPRGFSGMNFFFSPSFWITLARQPEVIPGRIFTEEPHEYWLNFVGRLKPGVTLRQAEAVVNVQLNQLLHGQTERYGETDQDIANSHIQLSGGAGGISYIRLQYSQALQILSVVMGIVLLMACANVANLLLSRSAAREREISVRLAVGASRSRLIRQLLTESLLLAIIGGALGILAAKWGAQGLALLVTGNTGLAQGSLDTKVLGFSIGVSLVAGVLFGLVPALRAGRADLAAPMKGSSNSPLRFNLPNGIVVFQIAGSVVLLIAAGLFVRTFQKLADQELGFDEDHILVVGIDPQRAGYQPEQTPPLYQSLIARFEAIPGVRSATLDNYNPLSGSSWSSNFAIEGKPPITDRTAIVEKELVGPKYFETEGIPILLGRDIGAEDRAGLPLVTVINETMARKYFPGVNPVGMRFSLGSPFNPKESMTIVGVAADARYYSLRDPVPPMEFAAALQVPDADSHNAGYLRDIEVRTAGDPQAVAESIRPAVKQVAADLPVTSLRPLKTVVDNTLRQNRAVAELSAGFGALALLLACTGLYGTLAYRVSRRTQEIGVRMALGAQRSSVLWLITKEGLLLIFPGLALGVFAALVSSKIVANQLFGVSPNDFLTFASTAALLLIVALVACWIPARRATRVDPMIALRHE
ncbi:MAG TPA: ABC transporter permease [Candidatus Acidoferrum sp.]|nr:ABC transporter permease [Candidatus Acidoferrum sp.]